MNKKNNVLIILTDQQRFDTIAANGYPHMITPNLDQLVTEGCTFSNAYSTNPVCMPARHDLLMGMPSKAHGFFANSEESHICDYGVPTIPRVFSENGYRTAAIGKMHFSPARMHNGYSEMYLMEELPRVRQDDDYATFLKDKGFKDIENIHGVRPFIYHEPQKPQMSDLCYETNWISGKTIDWLENNGDNPFMLCVGYIKPHPPWDVPIKYQRMYEGRAIPDAVPRSRQCPYNPEKDEWYGDFDTDEEKRQIREAYYSAITAVDESVGRILKHLRESGKIDDTLIIFTSDHGEMLQDKGFYSKELPYEGSAHIPMVIRYPKEFQAGTKDNRLVDLTDIFPTCLDVAGLKYSSTNYKLYGSSLTNSSKESDKCRDYVISASGYLNDMRFVMCRNDRYKYIYNYNGGIEECYDLVSDPQEIHNCIDQIKETDNYFKLKAKVIEYEKKWGPAGAVKDDNLVSFPLRIFHGELRGKYHLWSNHQFQKFTELEGDNREKQFKKELKYAAANAKYYKVPKEIGWMEDFQNGLKEYINS